jgi:hypothetical protein
LLLAAALAAAAVTRVAAQEVRCEDVESIGVAVMDRDGVITLRIRSLAPGPIAESEIRYAPNDPRYDEIVKHLGGLSPGQTKPVRPWC